MPDLNELIGQLVGLPRQQYSEVIKKVDAERRKASERVDQWPATGSGGKDEFARWVARQHFAIDKGISRIYYLPVDAPAKEIRLLEVNELAQVPQGAPVEAVDFMPDITGL